MNFADIYTEVDAILKRPDLTSRIESAIRAATLKIHTANFWTRDIEEQSVVFNVPNTITNFNPRPLFPQFRKMAYIRLWNYDANDQLNYGTPGKLLKATEMGDILDYWGYQKADLYYEAGDLIQIRTYQPLEYTLVGVYNFPIVSPNNQYSSWIARDYPWAIIHEATSQVCKQIGYDAMAQMQSQEAAMQLSILSMQSTKEPSIGV